jgi:nucleotide-binding universal stress UspA family protein
LNRRSERYARELQEKEYAGERDSYWPQEKSYPSQGRPEGSSAPARREQAAKATDDPPTEGQEWRGKYRQLIKERNEERKKFLEDVIGSLDVLSQQVASNLDGAVDAMKRSSKVAEVAEEQIAVIRQLREKVMGLPVTDGSTPSGDSDPRVAQLREEAKRLAVESADTLRKLAERKHLRESNVPVDVREAEAMREKRKRKDARGPQVDEREADRNSDSVDERVRLLYRLDRPQRRSRYHRFTSVESRHQVNKGDERLENERFVENRQGLHQEIQILLHSTM